MKHSPRALFLSHGGGPMPLLGDAGHADMVACLQRIATTIRAPSALVVVSAHWEERAPTVSTAAQHTLLYDYSGFPEAAYAIQYPCPGDPSLAAKVHALLADHRIPAGRDETRGLDHGVFVPLKIMYPDAHIPCVALSLVDSLDPAEHMAIGRALRGLHRGNVLLTGSGFTFHNMRAFFANGSDESRALNLSFEAWLKLMCRDPDLSEDEREHRLVHWSDAPGARFCHPHEEHLLPLHVCYGAVEEQCSESYRLEFIGKAASMLVW